MNQLSNQVRSPSRIRRWAPVGVVLLVSALLTGCGRPNDAQIVSELTRVYACKNLEIAEMYKTDSMTGIYSHVAQYSFHIRFKDGEEGSKQFFKDLFAVTDVKGNDWEKALASQKVQDFLEEDCTETTLPILNIMINTVVPQLESGKTELSLPHVVPMVGWSEFMPGRRGWEITVRRDKLGGVPVMGAPIKRELLYGKQLSAAKDKKKK